MKQHAPEPAPEHVPEQKPAQHPERPPEHQPTLVQIIEARAMAGERSALQRLTVALRLEKQHDLPPRYENLLA